MSPGGSERVGVWVVGNGGGGQPGKEPPHGNRSLLGKIGLIGQAILAEYCTLNWL